MSIVEKDIMSRVKKQNDFYIGQDVGVYTMQCSEGRYLQIIFCAKKKNRKKKKILTGYT